MSIKTTLQEDEIREELRAYCNLYGSLRAAAKKLGVSATFVGDILLKRRQVPQSIAQKLGYNKSIIYTKVSE
jgi:DNA invertase Pin-like site-specific DNA recombinase